MPKPIGVTIHHDDKSILKVPITDLAAAMQALLMTHGRGGAKSSYLNADECPVHGPWRAVPAGVSQRTRNSYPAFYACDQEQGEERCTNKPSREWVETHPIDGTPPDQAQTPEPTAPASGGEYDDLPF